MLSTSFYVPAIGPQSHSNSMKPLGVDWSQTIDMGTSDGVNAKVQVYDDQWRPLSETSAPQRLTYPSSNQHSDQLMRKKALEALVDVMAKNLKQIFSKKDDRIASGKNLIFFVPGQVQDNVVNRMGAGSETLHHFDFKLLPAKLQEKLQADSHLKINHETQMIILNDMAGGAASAMAQLAQKHPAKFQPGLDATYLMSGGGLGLAGVSYEDDQHSAPQVRIHLMELACLPNPKLGSNGQYSSMMNPLLAARLEEFAAALPQRYQQQKAKVIDSRNTQLITNYLKARDFLPGLTEEEFQIAACKSTRNYLDLLGGSLRSRIATGSNLAMLGGKTGAGYRDFVNSHPLLFQEELSEYNQQFKRPDEPEKSAFDKIFLVRIRRQLPEKLQGLFDMRQFDVVSDVNVESNTEGAPYIAKGWFQNRSDRFAMPINIFSNS